MGKRGFSSAVEQGPPSHEGNPSGWFAPYVAFITPDSAPAPPTAAPDCETWDDGRLVVNRRFARLLSDHRLTTCQRLLDFEGGEVVRRVGTRETRRLTLNGAEGPVGFYLKRHGLPAWRDRLMPWLHGSQPILGARNEWEAILQFIAAGIPTMTPVAFGERAGRSLLITEALPARCDLLEFIGGRREVGRSPQAGNTPPGGVGGRGPLSASRDQRALIVRVAEIARTMHAAGLHHQDFYLNHILLCENGGEPNLRVIDLGRVRRRQRLAVRWIVKDLAQLDFSAARLPFLERLRFLRLYLGRPFNSGDRRLVRRIVSKSRRIAVHTRKHGL